MSGKRDRAAMDDLLARIEEQEEKDDAERILAMSDEELDAELAAGGYDPQAVRAKGRALGAQIESAARRARLRRGAAVGAVATAVIAIATAWYLSRRSAPPSIVPEPILSPSPSPTPTPSPGPKELRLEAMTACDRKEWQRCVQLLERAQALDPAGDLAPDVKAARDRAARGLDEQLRELEAKPK